MIPLSVAEIAELVGGEPYDVDPAVLVTEPPTADSRQAVLGSMFVADGRGHDFAADAAQRGAVVVLASRRVPGVPCVVAPPAPGYRVDASVVALGRLARAVVDRLPDCTIVAVTGSSGKTGTKDLLAQVLATHRPTVAPEANLNNEFGVPLTVLRATESTRYLVLEMGAKAVGDLAYLTGIAPPHFSVVLNVGLAHVGEFGGKENVARAKGELVEALGPDGVAVLNADDPLVRGMADRTAGRVVLVGTAADAEVRAEDISLDAAGQPTFSLVTPEGSAPVRLRLVGAHHVGNTLAVAAVGRGVGMSLPDLAARLSAAERKGRWRMEVTHRRDGVTIVNDAYNANPDSMRAALHTLVGLGEASSGRTWAVLGEMLELGAASSGEHAELGKLAVGLGVSGIVAVGEGARPIHRAATAALGPGQPTGEEIAFVSDVDDAYKLLSERLRAGDVVLLKSSRDAGLRYLGDRLATPPDTAAPAEGTA